MKIYEIKNNLSEIYRLLSVIFILVIISHSYLKAQNSSDTLPKDTIFYEISLTNDGVTAIDKEGNEWNYDFNNEVFVLGDKSLTGEQAKLEHSEQAVSDYLPVQERCVVEKKVATYTKSVLVDEDEFVDGDVIAMGMITIKGWVKGNVKSLNARVLIKDGAQVDGNITAPDVILKEGAVVLGHIEETSEFLNPKSIEFSGDGIIIVTTFTLFLLFIAFILNTLMPKQMKNMEQFYHEGKLKAFLLGFLMFLLMVPIMALVTITIIGIFVIPLIFLAYIAAMFVGIIIFSNQIGNFVLSKISGASGKMIKSMVGVLLFMSLWYITAFVLGSESSASRETQAPGLVILVISILISIFPIFSGIGIVVLSKFGYKQFGQTKTEQTPIVDESNIPVPPPIRKSPDLD